MVILAVSLLLRAGWLGAPCHLPCRSGPAHVLIFDETYYVQAARVIDGIRPGAGAHYWTAPLGSDPNAEHPQLVKLLMAGSIRLLGDDPAGWRLPSLILGTLALLGIWVLARAVGASERVALCAVGAMALENLVFVGSRIGTLDVPALCGMLFCAALYLRGRWVAAGLLLGFAAAAKEVALLEVLVLGLAALTLPAPRGRVRQLAEVVGVAVLAVGLFVALLGVMGTLAPPWSDTTGHYVRGGALGELRHILTYGAHLRSPDGPRGIASYPWEWFVDSGWITYLNVDPVHPARDLVGVRPAVHFIGAINPTVLILGVPALLAAAWRRRRGRAASVETLGLCWLAGTWTPFAVASLLDQRTSYLYYMIVVEPALLLACAHWLGGPWRGWRHRARLGWWGVTLVAAVLLYPLTPV